MAERMVVRSYRRVFRVDRRIYRVDRWALPVPGGIPLRGIGYFALALGLVLVLGRLPGIGELVSVLSAPLRYVIVPLAVAVLGLQAAPDGRVAHRFRRLAALRLRGRRRSAGRRVPLDGERIAFGGTLATVWDERAPDLHRARVRGPARVTFNRAVRLRHRPGGRLLAEAGPTARQVARSCWAPARKRGAAMSGLPLRYVHQNLLVGDGDARAALYRVPTISYPFMPGAGKRDWLRGLRGWRSPSRRTCRCGA